MAADSADIAHPFQIIRNLGKGAFLQPKARADIFHGYRPAVCNMHQCFFLCTVNGDAFVFCLVTLKYKFATGIDEEMCIRDRPYMTRSNALRRKCWQS